MVETTFCCESIRYIASRSPKDSLWRTIADRRFILHTADTWQIKQIAEGPRVKKARTRRHPSLTKEWANSGGEVPSRNKN